MSAQKKIICEGELLKRCRFAWSPRHVCIISGDEHQCDFTMMIYDHRKRKMKKEFAMNMISAVKAGKGLSFQIFLMKRGNPVIHFRSRSEEERANWMALLKVGIGRGNIFHVKIMSKVNLLNEHALIKFVGCGNNDKSNRFLHLYDPVTENPIYIWSIDKIKEFARTDIGVRMTLCERCYRSHSLPHHHTFIVPAFFLDKCLSFFCRETRASIVFVGQGDDRTGSTVYQITSHDCGSRVLPPASPPPAPPKPPTSTASSVSHPISVPTPPLPSERPPFPLPSVPPVPPVPSVPDLTSQSHTVFVCSGGDFGTATIDQQHSSLKPTPKVSPSLPPRDLPRWEYLEGPAAYIPPDPLEPYSVSKRIHIDDKGRTLKLPITPRTSMRVPHQGSFVNVVPPRQTAFNSNRPHFQKQIVNDHPSSHPSHPFNHLASNNPTARHTPQSLLDPSTLHSGLTTASAIHNTETLPSSSLPSIRRLPTVHGETHPYVNVPILTPTQPPPLPPRIKMPAQTLTNSVSKSPAPIPKELSIKPFTQARRNQTMREIRSNKRPQDLYCCDSDTDVGIVSSYDTHNEAPDLSRDAVCTDNLNAELNDTRKIRSRTIDGIVDYIPNSDSNHSINPPDTTDTTDIMDSPVGTSTEVTIDSNVSPFPAVADSTFLQQPDSSTYAMGSPDVYSKMNGHFNTDPKFAMSVTNDVTASAYGNIRYNIVDNPQYRNYIPTSSDKKTDCFDGRQTEHDGNLMEVRDGENWDQLPELYINSISRNTVAVDREIPTFGNHGDEYDPNTGEVLERNVTSFTNNTGNFSPSTAPKQSFSDQSQLSGSMESSRVSPDPPPIPSKTSKSLSREHTKPTDGDGTHLREKNQPRRLPPPPATKPKPPLNLSQQRKISIKK